jgi:hypothetical protein
MENMTTIYFIFALLGGASLWNMISFYNLKLKVKNKKIEIIKLKKQGGKIIYLHSFLA